MEQNWIFESRCRRIHYHGSTFTERFRAWRAVGYGLLASLIEAI